ncbi:hypothetical protein G7B40_008680 [Aetokthonos hydrillicola Thurmond2011]|jgi:hypothetical protein|uniref:Uncharacterized protein n=1 Tax=Aetokthonos hydrillicola Thurmond2011 TaxID=2712845 RepID=A0AAP5I7G8_9CYAN|nr:hypothetical protein [Aetokthonos hydrillicola]MBO3457673.1 hypothetical protein [Aetokthonos hydrillicola CCALA 1050]MBW4587952.1 hypothetical protein [Aetokthonos hydrillicola CCALA 1050]MDR9894643.1 hypothetical protein [Aetokthonos hydrillicola Thurmond2011]
MPCRISYQDDCVEIESAEELLVALELTPPEVDEELLSQIGEKITEIVTNDEEFLLLLEKIIDTKGASKQPYLRCFGDKLNKVVTKGETLKKSLALLCRPSDQEYFLATLGQSALRKCISNVGDIAEALEWLYGKTDSFFLELIGWDFVIKFINSGACLSTLVKSIELQEARELLAKMGWEKVLECIQSPNDLMYAFIGLSGASDRDLIDKLVEHEKLQHVIPSTQELDKICQRGLSHENALYLRAKYSETKSSV